VTGESGSTPRAREEIEVKLPCRDLAAVRSALEKGGAILCADRHDEHNALYDDAGRGLSGGGRALRLRRAGGKTTLTYKGPARFEGGAKVREERETEVSDAVEIDAILRALGFERRFLYEKRREEWQWQGCVVALDETPIGRFVEIEGAPPAIRRLIADLSLDADEAIPYSYVELYLRKRKDDPALPPDMTWS
jgi:adenylate cyclase, class 2